MRTPSGSGRIAQSMRDRLREERRIRTVRTPGVMTSFTAAGTIQKPFARAGKASKSSGYIAVWI